MGAAGDGHFGLFFLDRLDTFRCFLDRLNAFGWYVSNEVVVVVVRLNIFECCISILYFRVFFRFIVLIFAIF